MSSSLYWLSKYFPIGQSWGGILYQPWSWTLHTLPLMCQSPQLQLLSLEVSMTESQLQTWNIIHQQLSIALLLFSKMTLFHNMTSRKRGKQVSASAKRILTLLSLLFYIFFYPFCRWQSCDQSTSRKNLPNGSVYDIFQTALGMESSQNCLWKQHRQHFHWWD